MKNCFFVIARFVLIFLPLSLFGQQIKHLGVYDGFLSGAVRTFEKDTLGYMWIGTSQGLNRYSGSKFKNYNQFLNNGVVDIISKDENLLVLSSTGELFQYLYDQDSFKNILNLKKLNFLCFELINDNTLVIGLQYGLLVYNFKSNKLSKVLYPKITFNRKIHVKNNKIYVASTKGINVFDYDEKTSRLVKHNTLLENNQIFDFAFDSQNRIWVGTNKQGVYIVENENLNPPTIHAHLLKKNTIRSITFDKDKNALIAPEGLGLFVVSPDFEIINKFRYDPDSFNSITQKSIYEIFVDEYNVYWLGLREVGIDLIYPKDNVFTNISYVPFKKNSIDDNNIRSIYYHENGDVWFGTETGISKLSTDGLWTNYNSNSNLSKQAVLTINRYGENLILGVYGMGLIQFDPKSAKIDKFLLLDNGKKSKSIFATYFDKNDIWLGGIDGPVKHYKNRRLVNTYNTGNARSIISNGEDLIYIGSVSGLVEINKTSKTSRKIKSKTYKNINQIYSLLFDKDNKCIWVGNNSGLFQYNLDSETFKFINTDLNFDSGTVFSIQKVSGNKLWLGTYSGLWKLDIDKGVIRKYDKADGLKIETFGFGASTKSINGQLAFGGPKGATLFHPQNLPPDKEDFKIYVSDFLVNGVAPDSTILAKNINYLDKIELNYNQNTLSFDFETPTFQGPKKQVFSWQLKGYDERPIISKTGEKAVYSKLPPGAYFLETKVTNVEGVLSPESFTLDIIIKDPFWLSHWAFLGYTLLAFVLIYLFILVRQSRSVQKFNENKIKFFTEVAHDIRTPVTLIQLLVSQLSDKNKFKNNIELIHRNTQNLNEYVTQLLDFQKADRGMLKLSVSKLDLKKIIHGTVAEVEPLLEKKSIDISVSVPKTYLWFDENKISRIFYNLISNAIKYTDDGGEIIIKASVDKKHTTIDFIDNGFGIPEKEQKQIFSRFTRGTNINNKGISGSGIGLMISKKIVELHGGKIDLKSKVNIGSTFTVTLLNGSEHYKEKELMINESNSSEFDSVIDSNLNSNYRVLLVEDNEDLRTTIKIELEKKYEVLDAPNGKEALLITLAKNPDLIITDVMMPVMGGKEFCKIIKTNFQTSHIPIIMISALGDIDDKIEGIEIGADAYLEKPFNMKILNVMVQNLITSRKNLYQISNSSSKTKAKEKSPDENFLSNVVEIIKNNINNSDFSIDLISKKTGLSRSNLFRKLKGLTNMSPVDLVIRIKLNHASELLKKNKSKRINEIAYESGFNDPKYFSTQFKKFYGKTPKEYSEEA